MGYREISLDYYAGGDPNLLLQLIGNTAGNTNGTWIDTSIYATPATQPTTTLQPILTADAFGIGNYGYLFSATKSMIVADRDNFTFSKDGNDTPFELSFKIKYTSALSTHNLISKKEGTDYEFEIYWASGGIRFLIYGQNDPNIYIRRTIAFSPILNDIYELVFKYNGSKTASGLTISVNGTEITGTTGSVGAYTNIQNTISPIIIGKTNYSSFTGYVSDILLKINTE